MSERKRLGFLTPSSNTILEPWVSRILAGAPDVTAHFARFPVTEISMSEAALGQFDFAPQLAASELLGEARVDVIAWGGTSGGWLGIDRDRELCRRISRLSGRPATSSTLALLAALDTVGANTYALVTPYLGEVQQAIIANFGAAGLRCVAERHLEDKGNYSFCEYGEEQIAGMVRAVAADRPQAIAIYCTNFLGARLAAALEDELGVPVLDSVSVTVWRALALAGADPARISGWGRLFAWPPPDRRAAGAGAG